MKLKTPNILKALKNRSIGSFPYIEKKKFDQDRGHYFSHDRNEEIKYFETKLFTFSDIK